MTASGLTLQNNANFAFSFSGISLSERQTKISGVMPIDRNSLTECCVGLVFSSPDAPRYGNKVKCMKMHCPLGLS